MDSGPFLFDTYTFEPRTGTLCLRYAYENGPSFEETIVFPVPDRALSEVDKPALDAAFRLIFLLSGVSYYKAFVPEKLVCRAFEIDAATAAFVEKVYLHGLGEFAFRNNLDLAEFRFNGVARGCIPALSPIAPSSPNAAMQRGATDALAERLLIPVGGGKDSIVALEALKQAGHAITLFALGGASGPAAPIRKTIEASDLPALFVARTLSPRLADVNASGALNGHVPITAILSAIALACAILHGHSAVVMSNEHSASAPNVTRDGLEINHQYSKSLSFEKDLAAYARTHIAPDLGYFSLLRPLTETAIAARFAKLEKYHAIFRSCNAAFRQNEARRGATWCCACPKCRFVFLALAPFMDKNKLVAIFGQNLLNDPMQTQGFAELCGLDAHKPFECVGEIEESAALLRRLAQSEAWQNDAVVGALSARVAGQNRTPFDALLAFQPDHLVPELFMEALRAPV